MTLCPLVPGDAEAMDTASAAAAEAHSASWHEGFSLDEMQNWTTLCQTFCQERTRLMRTLG
jgi:hypothetical protein